MKHRLWESVILFGEPNIMNSNLKPHLIIISMLVKYLNKGIVHCSQLKMSNQPFISFLSNIVSSLSVKRAQSRTSNSQQIYVSRKPVSRDQAINFFTSKNIKNKNVLLFVDGSHEIGIKRLISRQHYEKNIYQGYGEAVDILTKQNPANFIDINQIQFDQDIFLVTDPLYLESIKSIDSKQAMNKLISVYQNDRQRGGQRLLKQYGVPPEYVGVFEAAHNLGNKIYFIGINQYNLRTILGAYLKLSQAKILFMETLKYCHQQNGQINELFYCKAKQLLWRQHYSYLQPISHQLIRMFKRKVKGYYFAHPYLFNSIQQQDINFQQLKDKETDSHKLQKQAIFSAIYGNIWKKSYTNNPFPYLAQNYLTLGQDDQKTVLNLYNHHYQRYSFAKNNFFRLKREQIN